GIAQRPQDIGHAVRVVDIHLAPVGADEHALALAVCRDGSHRSPLLERRGSIITRPQGRGPGQRDESAHWPVSNAKKKLSILVCLTRPTLLLEVSSCSPESICGT